MRLSYHENGLSTKGQVVLPSRIRRKLGLKAGDSLEAKVQAGSVALTPRKAARARKASVLVDRVTGLPVLSAGPGAPVLTNKHVAEILAELS